MKILFDAIYTHFDSDIALKAVLTGGLWFLIAPQNDDNESPVVTPPYAVYNPITVGSSYTFTENYENFIFQFNIFSTSYENLEKVFDAFVGDENPGVGFDFAELTPSGYLPAKLIREARGYSYDQETRLWQMTLTYSIDLEKENASRK